jgi:hypothetical protein
MRWRRFQPLVDKVKPPGPQEYQPAVFDTGYLEQIAKYRKDVFDKFVIPAIEGIVKRHIGEAEGLVDNLLKSEGAQQDIAANMLHKIKFYDNKSYDKLNDFWTDIKTEKIGAANFAHSVVIVRGELKHLDAPEDEKYKEKYKFKLTSDGSEDRPILCKMHEKPIFKDEDVKVLGIIRMASDEEGIFFLESAVIYRKPFHIREKEQRQHPKAKEIRETEGV